MKISPCSICSLLAFSLFLALSGCGLASTGKEPTPEVRTVLTQRAASYIRALITYDSKSLGGMILWVDYSNNNKDNFTPEQFNKELELMRTDLPPDPSHPLLGLEIDSIRASGDNASVRLRKRNNDDADPIELKLLWIGGGWLISGDNIFGPNGVVTEAREARSALSQGSSG